MEDELPNEFDTDEETNALESDDLDSDEPEDEFTLDDLGAAYAEAMVEAGLILDAPESEASDDQPDSLKEDTDASESQDQQQIAAPTPEGVVEAALFIGHPENKPLTAKELARVMRDVSPKEVESIINALNEDYKSEGHAMRISKDQGGYRLVLSQDVDAVRRVFYGKVREARLSQLALEILALVAYQPGISASDLASQRGRDCGALLNQLVRRRLLEVTRERIEGEGRPVPRYFPTERFLNLFGLSSLEDLPQFEESVIQM